MTNEFEKRFPLLTAQIKKKKPYHTSFTGSAIEIKYYEGEEKKKQVYRFIECEVLEAQLQKARQ